MKIALSTLVLLFLAFPLLAEEVQELYSDTGAWDMFIEKVQRGDKEAITKAIELRKESDAGASSELNDALFVALKFEPQLILSESNQVCYGRNDPLSSYESAVKEVDIIIHSVSKINTDLAKECVQNLKNSKVHLAKYFGVKPNGL